MACHHHHHSLSILLLFLLAATALFSSFTFGEAARRMSSERLRERNGVSAGEGAGAAALIIDGVSSIKSNMELEELPLSHVQSFIDGFSDASIDSAARSLLSADPYTLS